MSTRGLRGAEQGGEAGDGVGTGAEALFILTDLCGLTADDAVASAVRTARTVTQAALQHGNPGT